MPALGASAGRASAGDGLALVALGAEPKFVAIERVAVEPELERRAPDGLSVEMHAGSA